MQNLIRQFSTSLTPNIRMTICVVIAIVLVIIVCRLLLLLVRVIRDGFTSMKMNALVTRIRHSKNIDNRVQLIDTYNERIRQISNRGKPRMPKVIMAVLTLVIIAALVVCALSFVMPNLDFTRKAVGIYTGLEKSLTAERKPAPAPEQPAAVESEAALDDAAPAPEAPEAEDPDAETADAPAQPADAQP